MRWKCPHCQSSLHIADEKVVSEWNMVRCYRCQGHSMIKRPTPTVAPAPQKASAPIKLPDPLPETPKTALYRKPLALALLSVFGVISISGGLLIQEGFKLWGKMKTTQRAPAVVIEGPAASPTLARMQPIQDEIVTPRMAPIRESHSEIERPKPSSFVRSRAAHTNLRSGPGMEFEVVGKIKRSETYAIEDWEGEWFLLRFPKEIQPYGWVRNDLLEVSLRD